MKVNIEYCFVLRNRIEDSKDKKGRLLKRGTSGPSQGSSQKIQGQQYGNEFVDYYFI